MEEIDINTSIEGLEKLEIVVRKLRKQLIKYVQSKSVDKKTQKLEKNKNNFVKPTINHKTNFTEAKIADKLISYADNLDDYFENSSFSKALLCTAECFKEMNYLQQNIESESKLGTFDQWKSSEADFTELYELRKRLKAKDASKSTETSENYRIFIQNIAVRI